jgi:hypothetical protein
MAAAVSEKPRRSSFGEKLSNYLLPVPKMLALIAIGLSTSVIWGVSAMLLKQAGYVVLGSIASIGSLIGVVATAVGWGLTKLAGAGFEEYKKSSKECTIKLGDFLCKALVATASLGLLQISRYNTIQFNSTVPIVRRAREFLEYTGLSEKKPISNPTLANLEDKIIQHTNGFSYKKERDGIWLRQVDEAGDPIIGGSYCKAPPEPILFTRALKQTLTLKEEFGMAAWVIDQISKEADKFKKAVFGPKKGITPDEGVQSV